MHAWGLRAALTGLAGIAGTALQLQQPALWPVAAYVGLLGPSLLAMVLTRHRPRARGAVLPLALACALFAATGLRAAHRLADALPAALEGQDIVVTGVVADLPRQAPDGVRFTFDVESALRDGMPVRVPQRLSLGWYRGWDGDALIAAPFEALRAGERWRLPVRLKAAHGALNPHGFDFELWLFEQGIRAGGDVRGTGRPAQRLDAAAAHPIERLRQRVRDAIALRVADPRAGGVLAALAVGDQAGIERSDWELFRATGIAHLVSISGLHVTMFAWLAGALVGALWRRSARAMLRVPAPVAARWGGVLCAAAYALLAGWGVPAQRTVWMLVTAAALAGFGLRWPWPLVLLAAALVVSVIDPWALLQPGFWLSFAAVGLLLASAPVQQNGAAPAPGKGRALTRALRQGLRTQLVATLGLAPLSLVFFQQVSVVGFIANLFAIPLVTLLITPLALLGVVVPPLWQAGAWLVQAMVQGLAWLAAFPGAVWSAGAAPWWAQCAGLLGALLLVAPLPWRRRALALPLMLPLFVPPQQRPAEGAMQVTVADVGQGSAVLVRTREHLLVHDAGPQYSRESEAGSRVLLPLLRGEATRRIDLLMLSHRDADHVGGAAALLAGLPVSALWSSIESTHPLRTGGPPHTRCEAGQHWVWDGVSFTVLHPRAHDYERAESRPNALSCVLRVADAAGHSLLLTGDIEAEQEARLVGDPASPLASEVLVVPHHGSKTSSSAAFLDAVKPDRAVVQAGYRNRFGHPAPAVLARYAERDIDVVRSDACGAWVWWTGIGEPAARCERERRARYWHHRPRGDGAELANH